MESIEENAIPVSSGIIKIYNPRDFPFGPLSNNYRFDMTIDGKRWATITNYIFSNMLIVPLYKIILQQAPIKGNTKKTKIDDKVAQIVANTTARQGYAPNREEVERIHQMVLQEISLQQMDIHQLYDFYLGQEYINTIRTAVEKAYNSKVTENKILADTLLNTEDRPIIYVSNNTLLGAGPDGNGQNLIGKILMQIRHNLKMAISDQTKKEEIDAFDTHVLTAYRAMHILQKELGSDNDLNEYIGKNSEDIVAKFLDDHPDENLETIGLGNHIKDSVLEMYKRGQLPIVKKELENPGYMVLAARRDNLKELQKRLETRKAEIILKKYTEHTIRKKYPRMSEADVSKASNQLLRVAPGEDQTDRVNSYLNLREKIVGRYMRGKFDDELNQEIEISLSDIPQISDNDVEKAEKMMPEEITIAPEEAKDSSSSAEDNPIKQLLGDSDIKSQKIFLIQQLQKYTGKASRKYKGWDLEKLEKELEKYATDKPPKEGTGQWVIRVKHPNNKIEILKKSTGARPGKNVIEKLVEKYNKKNSNRQIKLSQVYSRWETTVEPEKIVRFRSIIESVSPSYVKYVGEPIEIKPIVEQNPRELREFSPIYDKSFIVDGLSFPSVSLYITTMLVTQTGVSRDLKDRRIFKRGTLVSDARKLLMDSDEITFMSPDQANNVYHQRNVQTHHELMETYARVAMKKKFEDIGLGQLLLLTGNNELVWNDPGDVILGTGTKQNHGENIGGKILSEIREEIANNPKNYDLNKPLPKDIAKAISSDHFLNAWLKMRLGDMCSVVYKMKQYLSITGKQEEDIDSRFVTFVLNLVYYPCSGLILSSDKNQIPMPENFVDIVKECQGLPLKLSRDYDTEIKAVRDEMDDYDGNFWGEPILKEETLKKQISGQKFGKLLEAFKNKIPAPTQEEVAEYQKALTADYEDTNKPSKNNFEEKQRKDWETFITENNKPEKSWTEINEKLAKMQRKNARALKKETDIVAQREMIAEQKKKLSKFWENLIQPKLSLEERNRKMAEFQNRQDEERKEHYGWNVQTKTKEELSRHQEVLKNFKERIAILSRQKKEEENHRALNINDIARVYWDRLASMIVVIAQNIQNVTSKQVREIIVKAELLNSGEAACENIPENLNNPLDNCIAAALANILTGIESFKFQYQEDIPFGNPDIELALGILLGRDLEEPKAVIPEEMDENVVEFVEEDFEDDMGVEDREDQQEYDYGEDFVEEEEREEFGFARFGMKRPSERKEKIRMILAAIPKKTHDQPIRDEIVEYFINAIATVKTSKLPDRIKRNRINFFATVR